MPNLVTHIIFAEEVKKALKNKKYKNLIETYKEEFYIGANGPDFLFFYDLFPLWKKQNMEISRLGNKVHHEKINLFFKTALNAYHKQEEGTLKEGMAAYLIGHFLHWQMDSIMHPYVVYRTGFKEKLSSGYHHRFESMMDTFLLKKYWNTSISHYKSYEICKRSKISADVISNIYIPCMQTCFNKTINKEIITQALQEWEKAQTYLYDPYSIKYPIVRMVESLANIPYSISGSIIRNKCDMNYDVCNENHTLWRHPCTGEEFDESVYDLMELAIENAKNGLEHLFDALENKEYDAFLNFIGDKTYGNGIAEKLPRKYKNVIYKK